MYMPNLDVLFEALSRDISNQANLNNMLAFLNQHGKSVSFLQLQQGLNFYLTHPRLANFGDKLKFVLPYVMANQNLNTTVIKKMSYVRHLILQHALQLPENKLSRFNMEVYDDTSLRELFIVKGKGFFSRHNDAAWIKLIMDLDLRLTQLLTEKMTRDFCHTTRW